MNNRLPVLALATAAMLLAACSKPAPSGGESASGSAPAAATATTGGVRVIEITGTDQMKYDVTRIEAKAGETLRVVLRNNGTLPKTAMGHNFVLLKKGVDPMQFSIAAATAQATEYFPAAREGDVIAHTRLIGPKEKAEATFVVPSEPGEYTYLCTFPGHMASGMKGVLVVQ